MRFLKLPLFPFILLMMITLLSCNKQEQPLTGLWEFSAAGYAPGQRHADCFLNLQTDGKYTLFIPDYFDYGTYRQDKKDKNILRFTTYRKGHYYGDTFSVRITGGNADEQQVQLSLAAHAQLHPGFDTVVYDYITDKVKAELTLNRSAVQYPDIDPYSYNLNRWRIRADHKESCQEISYRVINFLKHMHALFDGQRKAESEKVGYQFSPSPLLFGANGIASKHITEVPGYWVHTFYDEGQALQGNNMISAIFDEPMTFPKGTKRYDEMWTGLLSQMISHATKKDFYCNTAGAKAP